MATYRLIPGLVGYMAGDDGSVWSKRRRNWADKVSPPWRQLVPKMRKTASGKSHRLEHCLMQSGKRIYRSVGFLILTAFVGKRPAGLQVLHKDDDPNNNALSNLRWGTAKENCADRESNGKTCSGESHHSAKLTDEMVLKLRAEPADARTADLIVKYGLYGISWSSVDRAIKGKTWKHLNVRGD